MIRVVLIAVGSALVLREGYVLRDSLDASFASFGGPSLAWWDVVVLCVSNAYTLVFLVVPLVLIFGVARLSVHTDHQYLVRYGSRTRAMLAHALACLRIMGVAVLITLGAALVVAAGRDFSMRWGPATQLQIPGNEALVTLGQATYPWAALLEEIALLALFSVALSVLQAAVRFWLGGDVLIALLSAASWVALIISFKAPLPIPDLLRPINYLVAYQARIEMGGVSQVMMVAALIASVVVGISWAAERRRPQDDLARSLA